MSTQAQIETLQAATAQENQSALDQCLIDKAARLAATRSWEPAENLLAPLLQRDQPPASASDLMARICLHQGRFSEADLHWRKCLAIQPGHPSALAALARLQRAQRHAVWLASPLAKVGAALFILLVALVPWWLETTASNRRESETRSRMTALHLESQASQKHLVDALASTLHVRLSDLAQQSEALAKVQRQNSEALADVPKIRADMQILTEVPRLRTETNSLQSRQKEFSDQLTAMQAGLIDQNKEHASVAEKNHASIQRELQSLVKTTTKDHTDSEARLQIALAATQQLVRDQAAQIQAIHARLSPTAPPDIEIPDAAVIAQGFDRYVLCTIDLLTPDLGITPAGKIWLDAFAHKVATLDPAPSVEIVLHVSNSNSAKTSRAVLLTALDHATALGRAFAAENSPLSANTILLAPIASIPPDVLTATKTKPSAIIRLRWSAHPR